MIRVGSDFSGVGAFDQALMRLGIDFNTIFACDNDVFARESYMANYGEPTYFPFDVNERKIPQEPLDIYMTSPPCQTFSLAGNRKGEEDDRGILFYNSLEFIRKNQPRYFIIENVKGLLSDNNGKTFKNWINLLGGKSVNANPVIFPYPDSVNYHIYYKVLNAKHFGVPQNRERVFFVGIRDDTDNTFNWPKPVHLEKRLKDVLEDNVDEKYYLSDKMINWINKHREKRKSANDFPIEKNSICQTITSRYYKCSAEDPYLGIKIGALRGRNPENTSNRTAGIPLEQRLEINKKGTSNAISTVQKDNVVVYGNLKGGKWDKTHEQSRRVYDPKGVGAALHTMSGGGQHHKIIEPYIKGGLQDNQLKRKDGVSPCLTSAMGKGGGHTPIHNYNYKIRRLTPRECFRLMDFPDTFKFVVSNSQLYKQAGNSIVVSVLANIIKKLEL